MKLHKDEVARKLFYGILFLSFVLFVVACSTTDMGQSGLSVHLLGYFDAHATAILLVGYPIAAALFYIGVSLKK